MIGIQSLTDILKQILQTFQAHTLFPAATLTFVTFLISPNYFFFRQNMDNIDLTVFLIIITIIISNMFAAFNGLIIRFIEGYEHENNKIVHILTDYLFKFLKQREENRHEKIVTELTQCEKDFNELDKIRLYYEGQQFIYNRPYPEKLSQIKRLLEKITERRNQLQIKLDNHFAPSRLMPTSFGNTILAFEYYPMKRYQIDGACLWPCLLPILEDKKFTHFLYNEKSRLDFLLNSALVSLIISIEAFMLFVFHSSNWNYLLLWGGLLILTCFLYIASVFAANDWGTMVKAAFDLYRHDLHNALHLKPLQDGNIHKERDLWRSVSEFLALGDSTKFEGFFYSQSMEQKK